MIKISVCKDFTDAPGPRYIIQGDFSGELFRSKWLIPNLKEALKNKEKIKTAEQLRLDKLFEEQLESR